VTNGPNARGGAASGGDGKSLVLAHTNIVDLIGQTVSLKRRGRDYVGLCPFHQEKTPSFHVKPDRQYFYCFGCKENGNAIDFVMKRYRVEFKEALLSLAQRAGDDLPRLGSGKSAASKEMQSERQVLLDAHSAACGLFEKWLHDGVTGRAAREYLKSRGFNDDAIKAFRIGLAPDAWDALLKSPAMKKFSPQQLALGGLVKARESGNGFYDTFRNRLMFPIRDETGRIIAFGGRVMPGSEDPAKYLNSPETPLFSKSRSVFGLDLGRQKIVETRTVAVVEGYTDVVMAHQYGASNTVSILGTAMTEQHVSILRRFADRIVLLFDADSAGDLAVNRAVQLFLTQPVEINIASMPEGKDPDEFLMAHGVDGWNRMLGEAQDALTYQWKRLARDFHDTGDLTAQQKAVSEYLELLSSARGSGPVDSLRWGMAVAQVSRLTDIPVDQLHRRFDSGAKGSRKRFVRAAMGVALLQGGVDGEPTNFAPEHVPSRQGPLTAQDRAERWLLGILLVEPDKWHDVQQHVQPEEFTPGPQRRLAEVYWQHQRDEGEPVFAELLGLLDAELKELAIRVVEDTDELDEETRALTRVDALRHFQQVRARNEKHQTLAQLRRTSDGQASAKTSESGKLPGPESTGAADEIELLKKLQEHARRPDLRRV
jgi:DNA primase